MKDEQDAHFFREGTHARLYDRLGCRLLDEGGAEFAVWAPNAKSVSVVGEWNSWSGEADTLEMRDAGVGVWHGKAPAARRGQAYKYRIQSAYKGYVVDKADPFAISMQAPPEKASRVWSLEYEWTDDAWMKSRGVRVVKAPGAPAAAPAPAPAEPAKKN